MRVLITGGAGFIGSHVADELLRRGHVVRALDNLSPAVHGPERRRPDYLSREVEPSSTWPPRWESARACIESPTTAPTTCRGQRR